MSDDDEFLFEADPLEFGPAAAFDHYAKVRTWLWRRATEFKSCALCGTREWSIQPLVGLPVVPFRERPDLENKVLRLVPLVCKTCGNTILLSAGVMGLDPR